MLLSIFHHLKTWFHADKSPGLGIEVEERQVVLKGEPEIETTTAEDLRKVKGALMILGKRKMKGDGWKLTAEHDSDTSINSLVPEWIIDGRIAALESGKVTKAASDIERELIAWQKRRQPGDQVSIKGFNQYVWKIESTGNSDPKNTSLGMQATAPLPLEAIPDLFLNAQGDRSSPLIGTYTLNDRVSHMHVVQKSHLNQDGTFPSGFTPDDAPDDVLGFLSLLVSYAKYADSTELQPTQSPKLITMIMPRTDFSTMFKSIKDRLPAQGCGRLFDLVKDLAVFKGDGTDNLDPDFSVEGKRKPSNRIDTFKFYFADSLAPSKVSTLSVRDWLNGLQKNEDMLTAMDKIIDGQIGALGSRMENVLGTSRLVPIFEFRDLHVKPDQLSKTVGQIEKTVVNYHKSMQDIPDMPTRQDARGTQRRLLPHLKRTFVCSGSTSI